MIKPQYGRSYKHTPGCPPHGKDSSHYDNNYCQWRYLLSRR